MYKAVGLAVVALYEAIASFAVEPLHFTSNFRCYNKGSIY